MKQASVVSLLLLGVSVSGFAIPADNVVVNRLPDEIPPIDHFERDNEVESPAVAARLFKRATPQCTAKDLTKQTWVDLKMDAWLDNFGKGKISALKTNAVQKFGSLVGAPNFFCGLSQYCNAGQPCEPVTLPAWYALVAAQNYVSYMNSIYIATGFAFSIVSTTLGQIVEDFYPKIKPDRTGFIDVLGIFNGVVSLVPVVGGKVALGGGIVQKLATAFTPPHVREPFFNWADISASLGEMQSLVQNTISANLSAVIDGDAQGRGGIFSILKGGDFLGQNRNITLNALQEAYVKTIQTRALALVLKAQSYYISMEYPPHRDVYGSEITCNKLISKNSHIYAGWCDKDNNAFYIYRGGPNKVQDMLQLVQKYGLSFELIYSGAVKCQRNHGNKGYFDPYKLGSNPLPADYTAECVWNVAVCEWDSDIRKAQDPKKSPWEQCRDAYGIPDNGW